MAKFEISKIFGGPITFVGRERYTHEISQKRHQNPGAISRYFNAQKAGPSLDPRCEGSECIRHLPKGH